MLAQAKEYRRRHPLPPEGGTQKLSDNGLIVAAKTGVVLRPALSTKTAAQYLDISPRSVRRLVEQGELSPIVRFRNYRFDRCDLDRLIESWKGGAQ